MALTHQGGTLSICATAQTPTLNQAAFEALTYVEIPGVVTAPSFRVSQNIINQPTLSDDIIQKQGGLREGEDSEMTIAFTGASNAGVAALEAAAQSQNIYAFKYELNNSGGTNGTIFYALFIVASGGGVTGGGVEDFANRSYNLAMTHQFPIEVDAA